MSPMDYSFLESAALLALLEDDQETAEEKLEELLPGELRALANAADRLEQMCWRVRSRKQAQKKP